jgi:hypothetical protein
LHLGYRRGEPKPEPPSQGHDALLAMWLDAAAESIEAENNDAAEVHVLLDGIVHECEFIIASAAGDLAA